MSVQNLYIPSSSGSYSCPAGDVRLRIYYDTSSTVSTTFDSPFEFSGKLQYDFSQRPNDLKCVLSSLRIKFFNKENVWETHCGQFVLDHCTDINKVFADVIIDGSVFWSGVIDPLSIKKTQYYNNSGLKYRWIELTFVDKLRVLEQYTVNEAGISDGDSVSSILVAMASAADLSGVNTTYAQFQWTEVNGKIYSLSGSMPTYPILTRDIDPSQNCLQLLKEIADCFGFVFFSYAGLMFVQSRNKGPFTGLAVVSSDSPIEFKEMTTPIVYAAAKSTMDYSTIHDNQRNYWLPKADTRRFEAGSRSANDAQNFVIDISAFASKCYADPPSDGANWFPAAPPDSVSDPVDRPGEIKFGIAGLGGDFDLTESGMILFYESLSEKRQWYTIVTLYDDDENHTCALDNGKTSSDVRMDTNFYVVRKNGVLPLGAKNYRLFKSYAVTKTAAELYAEAMLGTKSIAVREKSFRLPYYNVSFDGDNYFFEKISYDFERGVCEWEANSLGSAASAAAAIDSPPNQASVGSVDDGVHKVGASAIYNHINDGNLHVMRSANGVNYIKLAMEDGDVRFLYLKKVKGRVLLVVDDPAAPE